MQALVAAVQNGADAVYVGGRLFGARAGAANFDGPALQEAAGLLPQAQASSSI